MRQFRVILPVEINGLALHYGQEIEIDEETAASYAHALIAVREEKREGEGDGGNS